MIKNRVLALQEFTPKIFNSLSNNDGKRRPLIILHGLFGSKQNWRSLSKALSDKLNTIVVPMDLRNHGESFWSTEEISYENMAIDVATTIKEKYSNQFEHFDVIGHSMGAKVAMSLASHPNSKNLIKKLMIVDMTTRPTPLTGTFMKYIKQLDLVDKSGVKTKKEAETLLKEVEEDPAIIQFLLTNLVPFKELHSTAQELAVKYGNTEPNSLRIRVNLQALLKSPVQVEKVIFSSPEKDRSEILDTMVIYGTKAKYVLEEDKVDILKHFPSAEFCPINAGHWVHAERPEEFIKAVTNFILNKEKNS